MTCDLVATFDNRAAAQFAVDELMKAGLTKTDISVLMTQDTLGREFQVEDGDKTAEGIATGGIIGGIIGAAIGGLTAVGTVASGGSLLAVGPIVAALSGAGVGSATGGLVGGLTGMGIPEHQAKLSANEVSKGSILVGITVPDERKEEFKTILTDSGSRKVANG